MNEIRKGVFQVSANRSGTPVYHGLSRDVVVSIYDLSGNSLGDCTVQLLSPNDMIVYPPTWMLPGTTLTVVVIG